MSSGFYASWHRLWLEPAEWTRRPTAYPDLTVTRLKKALVFSPVTLDRMLAHMKTIGLPD